MYCAAGSAIVARNMTDMNATQSISPEHSPIDSALEAVKEPEIKALIDGTELEGWEPRAAWDDFKLGLKHGNEFTKIAIYGNKKWQEIAARVGGWFISGEVRYFEDRAAAIKWLST